MSEIDSAVLPALKPWEYICSRCGRKILFDKRGKARGWCAKCEVATWTPEKKSALGKLIGACWRGETERLSELTTEAMKHCAPKNPI
jgi:hypothetical protein